MINTQVIAKVTKQMVRATAIGALLTLAGCEVDELQVDVFDPGLEADTPWVEPGDDTDSVLEEFEDTETVGDTGDVHEDTCAEMDCTTPPADRCKGSELVTFAAAGLCSSDSSPHQCVYSVASREDCHATGLVCHAGSCAEPPAPTGEDLFISEVMANPAAVTDADGEWLEIGNASTRVLDLYEITVDNGTDNFTIDEHILLVPGGVAVFGRNGDATSNGNVTIDMTYSGFSLTNSSGELTLYRGEELIDTVSWESNSELEMPNGASIQRDPETGIWCASTYSWGTEEPEVEPGETAPAGDDDEETAVDRGTPGRINDSCEGIPEPTAHEGELIDNFFM